MKIKDLLKEIERCKKEYPDFLEWEVYTEQLEESDKEHKRKPSPPKERDDIVTLKNVIDAGYGQGWDIIREGGMDDWEYFHCAGFNSLFIKEKIFTVNVNF